MSTSITEVVESGGFNVENESDARWIVAQKENFEELIEYAEQVIERAEDERAELQRIEDEAEEAAAEAEYNRAFPPEERE